MTKNPSRIRFPKNGISRWFLVGIAALSTHCSSQPRYQTISYSEAKLATPPHNMSHRDYPFDEQGRYRRDWVRGGDSGSSSGGSSSRSSTTASQAPQTYRPAPAAAPTSPKPAARYHTVQRGDTLFSISRRFGVSVGKLKSVNGLTSDLIRIGQTLRIP